jgi:DNA-binding MarR family transcriptional regulator
MAINSYLKFLEATSKLEINILPNGKRILKEILKRGYGHPCRVQDIISMQEIASQATLHKALKELIADGYLMFKADPHDGRARHIQVTKKTNDLVQKVSKLNRPGFNGGSNF